MMLRCFLEVYALGLGAVVSKVGWVGSEGWRGGPWTRGCDLWGGGRERRGWKGGEDSEGKER